jgi:hypothetical protein
MILETNKNNQSEFTFQYLSIQFRAKYRNKTNEESETYSDRNPQGSLLVFSVEDKKIKVCLCLIKLYAMKAYGGMAVWNHVS